MKPFSWLEIDFDALAANVRAWRTHLGSAGAGLCAVVKADAYGLGAARVAPRLEAEGASMFAVHDLGEAEALLETGIERPVLVLLPIGELGPACRSAAAAGQLHWVGDTLERLSVLERLGRRLGAALPVHLHLDTGMSRGGLPPQRLEEAVARARDGTGLRLAGLCTHFATADQGPEGMDAQWRRFRACVRAHASRLPPDVLLHTDNTCAAMRAEHAPGSMARIGLGLYGLGPEMLPDGAAPERPALVPAVRWKARLAHVERYPAGASVGYGATHRLERDSRLGLLPVGYADGYPPGLGNRASVAGPDGQSFAPVVGRVNMDQIVVDLTDMSGVGVGDVLTVFSDDPESPCAIPRLAALAETHGYELLCHLSPRLPRYAAAPSRSAAAHRPVRPARQRGHG